MSFTGRRAFSSLFCLSKRAFSQHLLEPSWSRSSILHSKHTGPEQTVRDSLEFAEWHNGGGLFHRTALVDPSVFIEVGAIVHQKAVIGADVHIGSGSIVGPSVSIGQSTNIMYNAVLSNCSVGMSCVIHNGSCIGQDGMPPTIYIQAVHMLSSTGFGFFVDKEGNMMKKPQMLDVRIGDHVEIGANSCIDRGSVNIVLDFASGFTCSWRDTVVGDYTKIDNLVQIGHNVVIGKCCMLCGQVGIAGSVTMGDYCTLGGRVAVKDHVTIASKVRFASKSQFFAIGAQIQVHMAGTAEFRAGKEEFAEFFLRSEKYSSNFGFLGMTAKKVDALEERLEGEMNQIKENVEERMSSMEGQVADLRDMMKKMLEFQTQSAASDAKGPEAKNTNSEIHREEEEVEIVEGRRGRPHLEPFQREERGGGYGERQGYGGMEPRGAGWEHREGYYGRRGAVFEYRRGDFEDLVSRDWESVILLSNRGSLVSCCFLASSSKNTNIFFSFLSDFLCFPTVFAVFLLGCGGFTPYLGLSAKLSPARQVDSASPRQLRLLPPKQSQSLPKLTTGIVRLAANSGVTKDVGEPGDYAGFPAVPVHQWRRQSASLRRLSKKHLKESDS
ncbi:hypothetical protein M5K25_020427 [Dendrobium thyrsiflorum]|uniref:UDP-3-O-acylglucosamine N-acyltransferase 2, mitochondrial n=1 Tax=Dendrobium thyrsiflorum TaxID=117978 RepID=A0ABD0U9Z1_DENTH